MNFNSVSNKVNVTCYATACIASSVLIPWSQP